MASPAAVPDPQVPPADPQAIRTCLTPTLAAEFDHEWNTVLDRVKQSQDLTDLHELLATWRHTTHLWPSATSASVSTANRLVLHTAVAQCSTSAATVSSYPAAPQIFPD